MKYLLDTNILIWFSTQNSALSDSMLDIINDQGNTCIVSVASLWEIGIKYSLGKLKLDKSLESFFDDLNNADFIEILDISPTHILQQSVLPFLHRDPFDRMILAQSLTEDLEFLYTDHIFDRYSEELKSKNDNA